MSGSFKAYVEARRAGNHQTSPEASPRGQGPSAEGQGQTNEPTNYESARDMSPLVPEAVRRTWQQADREEHLLRQQMERILDDETLVHEAKSKRVGELFDSKSSAIADKRRETREALLKAADAAYRASIPVFSGETITASDSTALLATQNEAARI